MASRYDKGKQKGKVGEGGGGGVKGRWFRFVQLINVIAPKRNFTFLLFGALSCFTGVPSRYL